MLRVKAGLTGKKPTEVYTYVRNIQTTLTASAAYATVQPTPATINAALLVLNDLNGQMAGRMPVRAQRDNARKEVVRLVNQQVAAVNNIGNGDPFVLGESGYPFVKTPEPAGVPGVIATIYGNNRGPSGKVRFRWSKSAQARCYMLRWSYTPELPGSFVIVAPVFGNSKEITGFNSGSLVSVQVKGLNGADEGPWSDLAQIRVT